MSHITLSANRIGCGQANGRFLDYLILGDGALPEGERQGDRSVQPDRRLAGRWRRRFVAEVETVELKLRR